MCVFLSELYVFVLVCQVWMRCFAISYRVSSVQFHMHSDQHSDIAPVDHRLREYSFNVPSRLHKTMRCSNRATQCVVVVKVAIIPFIPHCALLYILIPVRLPMVAEANPAKASPLNTIDLLRTSLPNCALLARYLAVILSDPEGRNEFLVRSCWRSSVVDGLGCRFADLVFFWDVTTLCALSQTSDWAFVCSTCVRSALDSTTHAWCVAAGCSRCSERQAFC